MGDCSHGLQGFTVVSSGSSVVIFFRLNHLRYSKIVSFSDVSCRGVSTQCMKKVNHFTEIGVMRVYLRAELNTVQALIVQFVNHSSVTLSGE